ncbi:MAG: gamma-glutamyltransferase, partial [Candidatus Methylomirabilis sp.]|nr:gamma-glutamyltransferase [Deltaproteobacteria bacterium]
KLGRFSGSRAVFFRPDGKVLEEGDRLAQPNLAGTLERVAKEGPKGFYEGYVAKRIAEEMDRLGGLVTEEDLRAYRVVERAPVEGRYRGRRIVSFPPPSSGGVHVLQILRMLEGFDLAATGPESVRATHLLAEAMRRAFADRAKFLGDPDFVKVPAAGLLADPYLRARAASILLESASASKDVGPGAPEGAPPESDHTTHLSVVDASGAAVAMTLTINGPFGSCLVAADTGVLLNNQMDDFSAQPGAPNLYGLVGGEANAVAPRKTPLSSMSPTLVFSKDGKLELVVGSPGGPRIISTVAQAILNVLDHGLPLDEALAAPRAHHQWLPDKLLLEGKFPKETAEKLRALGHSVGRGGAWSR